MLVVNRICDLALCLTLLCAGCALCDDGSGSSDTVSFQDNGKTIKVKTGEKIRIQLPVQFGTGYSWQIPKEEQSLYSAKEETSLLKGPSQPGSAEIQEFVLSFKEPIAREIIFQYRRPWDPSNSPAKTFRLKIVAQK